MMLRLVNSSSPAEHGAWFVADPVPGLAPRVALSDHERLRDLACRLAAVVPVPSPALAEDAVARTLLVDVIADMADALASAAHRDKRTLSRAIGPRIEVGSNPLWRMLLEYAHARCSTLLSGDRDMLSA